MSDRWNLRGHFLVFNALVMIVGVAVLGFAAEPYVRYFGAFLVVAGKPLHLHRALRPPLTSPRLKLKCTRCNDLSSKQRRRAVETSIHIRQHGSPGRYWRDHRRHSLPHPGFAELLSRSGDLLHRCCSDYRERDRDDTVYAESEPKASQRPHCDRGRARLPLHPLN